MIHVDHLTKRFGDTQALRGVSFRADDGAITGLLGPNGAGKTTTLRILCGLLPPDQGSARVDDHDAQGDPMALRRALGALSHSAGLWPRLTPREHLKYFGQLHGLSRALIDERTRRLFSLLEMEPFADRRTEGFSQGQKLKVAIARALIHEPQNVILDEPTAGLDVSGARAMRDVIKALKAQGRCVLFSSHVMQEVAAVCDRIVIIAGGVVAAHGTVAELMAQSGQGSLEDAFVHFAFGAEALASSPSSSEPDASQGSVQP